MSGAGKRAQPRQNSRFRVLSRELPGYRGVSLDFSQSGIQLETEGPLQVGQEMVLDMEFDREHLADFSCPARVVWCAPDRGRDTWFRTGLAFAPTDEAQRTALARTATVLQARSEADLETLLDEAKKLDPERAETFTRVWTQGKPATGSAPRRVLPLLGVYIPLRIVIDGYDWNREPGFLTVRFLDQRQKHHLHFPNCRLLTDYGCANQPTVTALFCTPHSEIIKRLPKPTEGEGWKHYRFLQGDRQPVLELVSSPCVAHLQGPDPNPQG